MKISIYTLNGYKNYGNRLQLFALAKTIANLKHSVTTYWPSTKYNTLKSFIKFQTPLTLLFRKEVKLRHFTKLHTPIISNSCNENCRIIGSDQVWNLNYLDNQEYLLNVPNNGVNISYAASIGYSRLPEWQKKKFKEALKRYKALSVRERSAKELLQPLTNKRIEVVLDPTLLLDKTEYSKLEKKPRNIKLGEKYVLCYILGNRDYQEPIEKFAKEKNYKTIYFSDKRDSSYGIEEFLYLIHHAQLICTDSFHACVFSFIFERPFIAFKRTGKENYMYTRLQNLIDTFRLKNREFNGKEITKENLEVDYAEAKEILKKEQEKSLAFLKKALDIKNER